MIGYYILLIKPAGSTRMYVADRAPHSPIVATEENKYLLEGVGNKLLDEGTIVGWQLAMFASDPVTVAGREALNQNGEA